MLYEIWSLGHKPFETMGTDEVFINHDPCMCTFNILFSC